MRRVVLSHPGTGPFIQQTAQALHEAGLLAAYVTTFAYRPSSLSGRLLRAGLRTISANPHRLLVRRRVLGVPDTLVVSYPLPEYLRVLARKARLGDIAVDLVWEQSELWFDRTVARRHVPGSAAVYGYEHACLRSFQAQRERGGLCIYEMPGTHYRAVERIMNAEFERFPELQTAYRTHTARQDPRRNARREAELQLAHRIVVNSSFARDCLLQAGVGEDRITVVPLGAPPIVEGERDERNGPFVFLSAGSQSARKGTHYLLQAWRTLAPRAGAELWLTGSMKLPPSLLAGLPGTVVARNTVPQQELFEHFRRADVLVFPSLSEGFGMVITEAMAHGLPVITTPNTAGRDLINHGENGLLVPAGDADALAAAMEWCLDHPDAVREMGRRARTTAAGWQWPDYRAALARVVGRVLGDCPASARSG